MTVGYFCAIFISLMFMLYLDGGIGVMMLAFLILMPLLSLLAALWTRRRIRLTLTVPDTASKQQPFDAVLHLTKQTWLPMPFLRLHFTADAHFAPVVPNAEPLPPKPVRGSSASNYRRELRQWKFSRDTQLTPESLPLCLSIGVDREADYRLSLTPQICGRGILKTENIILSDYLGMFRFRLPVTCEASVTVMPEIPDMSANSALFRTVSDAVNTADEETESAPSFSASSQPGYEHRGYIPGDSLKRINWKLSSKRHQLMVRRDEPVALARLSVVLDFRRPQNGLRMAEELAAEEQLIETALGFLMLCAKNGYPCMLSYVNADCEWSVLPIDDGGQLQTEAVTLLAGGFRDAETLSGLPLLPQEVQQDAGILLVYFTASPDADASAALEHLQSDSYLVTAQRFAVSAAAGRRTDLWFVTPDRKLVSMDGVS